MLPGVTTLGEPLTRALGPRTAKALEAAFGMRTVGDLLRHYPRRYYTRGELTDLSSLREGDHVTVLARVDHVGTHKMPSKGYSAGRAEVVITDDRAKLILTFFWRNAGGQYVIKPLVPGVVGMFAGTVSRFRTRLQLVHPEYELLPGAPPNADLTPELAAEFAAEMIPVYPASAKASSWMIARAVKTVLDPLDAGEDPLPAELRERHGLARPGRGDPRYPPAARPGRPEAGQGAAQVGRGVPAAGRAGAAAAGRRGHAGHAASARRRRHRRRVRRAAAIHPHRGAGRGGRDDRRGAGLRLPDAPAAAGRGRLGQDGDRDPGHAPGGGRGRAGGPARPDRGARPAALPVRHRHARPAGPGRAARRGRARHRRGPAHRVGRGGRPASGAVRRVHRRRRDRDRHPRPARGAGPVRRPGPGGDRRAAQVRRGAA